MNKLRVVKVLVQPVCVIDDGTTLTEMPVAPKEVPYALWAAFDLEAALEPVRRQVEEPAPPEPTQERN